MRDLFFLGYLGLMAAWGLRRPFLFTLAYAYIDIVAPQRLSYYLLNALQVSLIMFLLALGGWLIADDKRDVRVAPRQFWMLALLLYCGYTTFNADVPVDALAKWDWVWKALVFAIFLPLTLRTRLRIEALALTMVLSASALIVTGGIKTLASGGGYGALVLLVDNNTGLYEGSIISCVAIALIPLIVWLARFGTIFPLPDRRVQLYALALIFACLLIPIGTQARTGLVCIAVLGLLALRFTKRRLLYLGGIAALGAVTIPFLPTAFTQRMDTIQNYKADESASTRLAVWAWTWDYVKDNPLGGGFDAYKQNKLRYELVQTDDNGFDTGERDTLEIVDEGRAYHSSYFEMLGENGFFGLFVWLIIHVGGVCRMEAVRRRHRRRVAAGHMDEDWIAPLALALQSAEIVYLVGSIFVGIAFQPFVYMLVGMQIGLDTYCHRRVRGEATPARRAARTDRADPQPS